MTQNPEEMKFDSDEKILACHMIRFPNISGVMRDI